MLLSALWIVLHMKRNLKICNGWGLCILVVTYLFVLILDFCSDFENPKYSNEFAIPDYRHFFLSESKQINVVHVSHLGNEVCFWKPYVALNGPNVAVFPHWGQLIQLGGSRDTCQVTHSVMNMCSVHMNIHFSPLGMHSLRHKR